MTKRPCSEKKYYAFNDAFDLVARGIDDALVKSPVTIRRFIAYLSRSKGKLLRSQLLLCCAQNDDDLIDDAAIELAISLELLHLASLIHDDVIDDGDTRRSLPTLNRKFDRKIAVIAGDYLLAKSLEQVHHIAAKREPLDRKIELPNYMTALCLGEINQHANNGNLNLTIRTYLNIIRGKTATLFEAACFMGGVLISDDDDVLEAYKKFGRHLGMVFQISDDIIDYTAQKRQAGKNVQNDFAQGVITLPLIYALEENPAVKPSIASGAKTPLDILAFVRSSNGIARAQATSKRYYRRANQQLSKMSINRQKENALRGYLDGAYRGLSK